MVPMKVESSLIACATRLSPCTCCACYCGGGGGRGGGVELWWHRGAGSSSSRLWGTQSIHSLPLHTVTVTTPPLTSQKPVSGREPRGRHVGGRQPPHGRVHDPLKLKPSHQSRSQAATAGRPSLMGGSKLSGGRRRSAAAYTL